MYEDQTYEVILNRTLDEIPDTIDKRQGSVIYDALAPACIELAQMYIELDNILKLVFAGTSSGEYLEKRCDEIGITRKEATKAVRKGVFTGANPPVDSRFSLNNLTYRVIDNSEGMADVQLECEQTGSQGNNDTGSIIPITEIQGLTSALMTDILIPGEDEETDEALLSRFNTRIKKSSTSGNIYHYLEWANEVDGVGAARVVPLYNGGNTLKVMIVDADMQPATDTLANDVQQYIDPDGEGLGKGQAPIGAKCTVVPAESTAINIAADISGVEPSGVVENFRQKLSAYFKTLITEDWQSKDEFVVNYTTIGSILLESIGEAGGNEHSNLLVNNVAAQNIKLSDHIPTVGTVTFNEAS